MARRFVGGETPRRPAATRDSNPPPSRAQEDGSGTDCTINSWMGEPPEKLIVPG